MSQYNRLFKNAVIGKCISEKQLGQIDKIMFSARPGGSADIPAGYTYIGQMISHDITPSTDDISDRANIVEPTLELRSLYGKAKRNNYSINGKLIIKNGLFQLSSDGTDLLRDDNTVLIPDKRNDENILISRLHLFWQKLHNVIYEKYLLLHYPELRDYPNRRFKAAKSLVIKIFQQLTIDDFLYHVLDSDIYKLYFRNQHLTPSPLFEDAVSVFNELPLEFSHAVFRFGHSMIRDSYDLNDDAKGKTLSELFVKDHSESIDPKLKVEWWRFFGGHFGKRPQSAMKIDLNIANSMSMLRSIRNSPSIAALNLSAANSVGLPTGGGVLNYVRKNLPDLAKNAGLLKEAYIVPSNDQLNNVFSKPEDVPLWLYTLLESFEHNDGLRLGKVGSIIVAEVILRSIKHSQVSVLKEPVTISPKKKDSRFKVIFEKYSRFTMLDVLDFYFEYK